jgi:hypothetical protein
MQEYETINGIKIPYGFLLLEPREYHDEAVVGFEEAVLYDWGKLVESYMKQGFTSDSALEWIGYNTDSEYQFFGGTDYGCSPRIINIPTYFEREENEE